jgi:hypothetical protein
MATPDNIKNNASWCPVCANKRWVKTLKRWLNGWQGKDWDAVFNAPTAHNTLQKTYAQSFKASFATVTLSEMCAEIVI